MITKLEQRRKEAEREDREHERFRPKGWRAGLMYDLYRLKKECWTDRMLRELAFAEVHAKHPDLPQPKQSDMVREFMHELEEEWG